MRDKIKTLIISILLISVTTISFGYTVHSATLTTTNNGSDTYYVSTTGNDNNAGTLSSPWRTIQKAANAVGPGDTVYVRGGTYKEKVVITRSGTSSAWITFKNYQNELPIVDGNGISAPSWAGGVIHVSSASYILVDGFKVQNAVASGICVLRSHDVTVQNCYTTNTGYSGIRVDYGEGSSNKVYCTKVKILHNTIAVSNTRSSQEALTFSGVADSEIKYNNLLSNCKKEGITCKEDCQNLEIAYNDVATPGVNIYVGNSPKGTAHDFYVYNNYVRGGNPGICISQESPGPGTSKNFYIYNNIITNNGHSIGYISDQPGSYGVANVNIFNNVLAGSSYGVRITPYSNSMSWKQVTIRNNIFVHGGIYLKSTQPSNELTIDHNCFKGTSSYYGNSAIRSDPKLTTDYHLQSTSPCINAGSSIGAPNFDYDGYSRTQNTIDIGAFEYGSTRIVEVIELRSTSTTTTNTDTSTNTYTNSNTDTTPDNTETTNTETTTSNTYYTHTYYPRTYTNSNTDTTSDNTETTNTDTNTNTYYTRTNTNSDTDTTPDTTQTTNTETTDTTNIEDTTTIESSNTQSTDNYQENQNNLVQKPTISGKTNGKTDKEYEYKFTSTDPQGDNIYYCINWGDGTKEVWVGPYESGTTVSFIHKWTEKGSYTIKVKVMDTHGTESDWTTLKVNIRNSLGRVFWRISERYPLMGNLLNQR